VGAPTGTVTFLFTDIEGSTRLWEADPDAMRAALVSHDSIVRGAIEAHSGHVFATGGDGFAAAFARAGDALGSAAAAQAMLVAQEWPPEAPLRVRMGVHTGEATERDGDYFGPAVNRAARLMTAGHGGQVLVSAATAEVVGTVALVDLGEHRLRDLARAERVYQLRAPGLPDAFPPLRSSTARSGNLPRQMTSFVGRARELALVGDALRERPLVTLTGVGGVGKTRLALQAAAEAAAAFPDGAWVCELAPLTNPGAVWEAVAASLGVKPAIGRDLSETVVEYLAAKQLLLALDNCEHLLEATAKLVDAVAHECPGVVILATSREGLGLAGELIVAVPSLGLPDDAASVEALSTTDAVRLFVERTRDANASFALTPDNAAAVAQLCRRLDGIPLAIELAAARARSMTPEDLLERIDQRFTLLTRGSRAALERQQTLRRTIDWSYELLGPPEREALLRFAVFAGGCGLPAAEAVVAGGAVGPADVVDVLAQLVDKSLVIVEDNRGRARYRMLETIRQYAQERLDDSGTAPSVRRAHADYYVVLAESAGPHLRGRGQLVWARDLAVEIANLRAAVDWTVEQASPEPALRLVAPLTVQGLEVGDAAMEWAAAASAIPGADAHPLFATVASWAVWGATVRRDYDRARTTLGRVAAFEELQGRWEAAACRAAATLAFFTGDLETAHRWGDEWVRVARSDGDAYEVSQALVMDAASVLFTGQRGSDPIPIYEEAIRIARDAGILTALAIALSGLATALTRVDTRALDPETARRAAVVAEEAFEVGTLIGDPTSVDIARHLRGQIAMRRGEFRAALEAYAESAEVIIARGGRTTVLMPLVIMAACAFAGAGHAETAAVLLGAGDTLSPTRFGPGWAMQWLSELDSALPQQLGAERFVELRSQGAALGPSEAVEYVRVEAERVLANE
jgi:predicted ATPase/class 3 adenylate cyclase